SDLYSLSLHDALPIFPEQYGAVAGRPCVWACHCGRTARRVERIVGEGVLRVEVRGAGVSSWRDEAEKAKPERRIDDCHEMIRKRSEEHTSELQSRENL